MRVLFATTEFPWPPSSGGRARTVSELRVLASLPEVTELRIVSLHEGDARSSDVQALRSALGTKAHVVSPVFHPVHLKQHLAHVPRVAVFRALGLPYLAAKWRGPNVQRALVSALAEGPWDAIYVDHLGMAAYFPLIRKLAKRARIVLGQHNVESDFFAQFAEKKSGVVHAVAHREYLAARAFEAKALREADAVIAISGDDADAFRKLSEVHSVVVPQVMTFERKQRDLAKKPRLVYLGNLSWHPNVEGLDWFCTEVWPLVRAALPSAELDVGGSGLAKDANGSPVVPTKWQKPGIRVVGFVDNLETFYEGAAATLAPILGGSGVRIKVLEAFRSGLPLVTTPAGALGLPVEDGTHAAVSGGPQGFADACVRLARDEEYARRIVSGGWDFIAKHHSLQTASRAMRRALRLPQDPASRTSSESSA